MSPTEPATTGGHRPPPWIRRAILTWWLSGAALWLFYILARELRSLLVQIVLALFLSFAIEPFVDRMQNRGLKRAYGALLALVGFIVVLLLFVALMGNLIADQVNQLVEQLPGYINSAQDWLADSVGVEIGADELLAQLQPGGGASQFATGFAGNLVGYGTAIAGILFQLLTILIFAFYFTADGPRMRANICSLFPPQRQSEILRVWELAVNKTGAYISSRVLLAGFSAVFHFCIFTLLGLPSAVALALWVGLISQFIPAIGTYIAGLLPMLVAVGIDPTKAIWVLVAVVAYQQIENYVLQPRITAQTLDMHPAVAIAAVLAGTTLFGVAGALLALPMVATITGFATAYIDRHEVVSNELTLRTPTKGFRRRATDLVANWAEDNSTESEDDGGTSPDVDGLEDA